MDARDILQLTRRDFLVKAWRGHEFFSDKVDTVAGAVGKKTNLGQQVFKLRSSLRGRPAASTTTTDTTKAA